MSQVSTDSALFTDIQAGSSSGFGPGLMSVALQSIIGVYQKYISGLLGTRCRFYPSCSHYAHECLGKYPLARAVPKVISRLARCQPWHPGGIDLP